MPWVGNGVFIASVPYKIARPILLRLFNMDLRMKTSSILLGLILLFVQQLAYSQETRVYLKEAHIIVSLAAASPTPEGLLVRGVNHKGQKIAVRIDGLEALQGGKQIKSDCVKYFAMATSVPNMRMELYVSGLSPTVATGPDPRGYRAITFQLTNPSVVAGCVLSDSTKFNDQTAPAVIWYELP